MPPGTIRGSAFALAAAGGATTLCEGMRRRGVAAEMVRSPFRVGRQPTSTATGERRLAPASLHSLEDFAGIPPICLISVGTRRAR
jgi:hypothetical protein